jgi:hypothetical protein
MVLSLAFGLFLAVPLLLLVHSLGRTAVASTRRREEFSPQTVLTPAEPPAPVHVVSPAPVMGSAALGRGRRVRPAVPGGSRRDSFGDTRAANRPLSTAGR